MVAWDDAVRLSKEAGKKGSRKKEERKVSGCSVYAIYDGETKLRGDFRDISDAEGWFAHYKNKGYRELHIKEFWSIKGQMVER